jgi:hypothetical protein
MRAKNGPPNTETFLVTTAGRKGPERRADMAVITETISKVRYDRAASTASLSRPSRPGTPISHSWRPSHLVAARCCTNTCADIVHAGRYRGFFNYGKPLADGSVPSDETLVERIAALWPSLRNRVARSVTTSLFLLARRQSTRADGPKRLLSDGYGFLQLRRSEPPK